MYKCEGTTAQKQAIIDAEDSALYCRYSRGHQVGDHVGSIHDDAVWDVSLISIGDVAILYTEDGAEYYECTAIYKVKRGQYYFHRGKAITVDPHDIIALSCVEGEDGYEYCAYFDYKFTG
ncbi:MAG: hypothetical protein IKE23_08915 [Exiguobacterium sp.]|nr:hypothetical protein [Exiguobacterium sp.]